MSGDVTALIDAANRGDPAASGRLFDLVYGELKMLARKQLRGMPSATLETTGLVHEAYLKLVRSPTSDLQDRAHFFALSARIMRQIVIDQVRARLAEKRGGVDAEVIPLQDLADIAGAPYEPESLLRLDVALRELERDEPRLASLVEMRFFAGLGVAEIAQSQQVSERTLNRDWRRARALIYSAMNPD